MELMVLTIPDCPHGPLLESRLNQALDGRSDVQIFRRVVADAAEAARLGMHGSPTLLIDGRDPFAVDDPPTSVSCRLFRAENGQLTGAPTVKQLREVLAVAPDGAFVPLERGLRKVHQAILSGFATTGHAPTQAELARAVGAPSASVKEALVKLHAADFLQLDADGAVQVAYPFSATPTPHQVQIVGDAQVFAMCAVDALGMARMLQSDVRITTVDAHNQDPVAITVRADGETAQWSPRSAVVFVGQSVECGPCEPTTGPVADRAVSSAEACCGHVNFFGTPASAQAWAAQHPSVAGDIVDQQTALKLGAQIFGPLLDRF